MSKELKLFQFHEFIQSSIQHIIKEIGPPKTVVEIGVFQGYFTFNMTGMLAPSIPDYKHYAIDPFDASHDLDDDKIAEAYDIFTENLKNFPLSKHIEFIRNKSWPVLMDLINKDIQPDLIYIDGDHRAAGVLEDLVLSYKLLKIGGVILCDDSVSWVHTDKNKIKQPQMSPRLAVDNFIQCYWDKIELLNLPNGWQSGFIKRAE